MPERNCFFLMGGVPLGETLKELLDTLTVSNLTTLCENSWQFWLLKKITTDITASSRGSRIWRTFSDPQNHFLWTRMLRFSRQKCRILTFCDKNFIFKKFRDKWDWGKRTRKEKENEEGERVRKRGRRKKKEKEERERGRRKRKEKEEGEKGRRKRKEIW